MAMPTRRPTASEIATGTTISGDIPNTVAELAAASDDPVGSGMPALDGSSDFVLCAAGVTAVDAFAFADEVELAVKFNDVELALDKRDDVMVVEAELAVDVNGVELVLAAVEVFAESEVKLVVDVSNVELDKLVVDITRLFTTHKSYNGAIYHPQVI